MSSRLPRAGDIVRIRDARWRVESRAAHGSVATIQVIGLDHETRGCRTSYLLPFDRCEAQPFDGRPRRVRRTEWVRVVRRLLADATPSWESLRTAARARIAILPFQLEPALTLVRSGACRMLIADAVGLGKTIQAGLMVAETLSRTAEARVLIATPAGLRDQWAAELRDHFALDAVILDALSVPRAEAGRNPWAALPLAITSVDYIKRPDVIRGLEGLVWDLIVFDEAHALAGRSDRATAAGALARRARSIVMLTATPHSGDDAAFERLRTMGDLGGAFPLLVFRRSRAVLGAAQPRRLCYLRVRPTDAERTMHSTLDRYARLVEEATESPGAHLAISVLRRRASSSAASLVISVERRLALLSEPVTRPIDLFLPFGEPPDGDATADEELATPAFTDRRAELRELDRLLAAATRATADESKLRRLKRLLSRVDESAIVFTQYRDTLATLAAAIGGPHATLHGGLTSSERSEQARRFTQGEARLLLATDAASEGLNLQQRCRLVIHLELPWTATRLEQRIGRVDRLGQTRRVHSIHLLASGTSEDHVWARLEGRSARAEHALEQAPTDRGAQTESSAHVAHPGAVDAPVADLVTSECGRIETARRLSRFEAATIPARPAVTSLRNRAAPSVWAARLPFTDAGGELVWESVLALAAAPGSARTSEFLLHAADGRLALNALIQRLLARVQAAVSRAVESRLARESAIVTELTAECARLSAALLQRGLFEHRGERLASAQDAVLREALDRLAERTASLEHMRQIVPADPVALFGARSGR